MGRVKDLLITTLSEERMKVIYIAGPYRAATPHGILENIRRAEALAIEVWRAGYIAFCPHLNSAFFDGLVPDEMFLAGTMEMLSRCDGVIIVEEWADSLGTRAELDYCYSNRIPVFYSLHELQYYQMW
jgi:nucleoside 2-deoxyribosyltransferase